MIASPRDVSIKDWADALVSDLDVFGQVPVLIDESLWQEWGQQIAALPGLAAYAPPNPADFDNFFDWAERFVQVVQL